MKPATPTRLATLAWIALAIRLVTLFAPGLPAPAVYEDGAIARNMAAGHGFTLHPSFGRTAVKAPAYPALLYPLAVATTDEAGFLRAAGLLNAVLGAVAVLLVGRLATALFDPRCGWWAALALAVHPSHAYLARVPESTNLSIVLGAAALHTLIAAMRAGTASRWLSAGALTGAAILSNPVIAPGMTVAAGLLAIRHRPTRAALIGPLAMLLVLAPWTHRNYRLFDRLIAVKSPLWLDIYAGLLPRNLDGRQILPPGMREHIDELATGTPEIEREELLRRELSPWIRANPGVVLSTATWRVGQYWGLYGQRRQSPPRPWLDFTLRLAPEMALLALSLLGTIIGARRAPHATLLAWVFVGSYTAAYSLIVAVNVRYHLEVVWAQMLLVGLALDRLAVAWRRVRGADR